MDNSVNTNESKMPVSPPSSSEPFAPMPAVYQQPAKRPITLFTLIKRIIYAIVGIVCLFGVWSAISDNFLSHTNSSISPTPTVIVTWKTYTNSKFHYLVKYPDNLEMSQETPYSIVYQVKDRTRLVFPSLYVSVLPNGFTNKDSVYNYLSADIVNNFFTLQDNQSQVIEPGQDPQYWTYTRLGVLPVADVTGVMIENKNVWDSQDGVINRRVLVKKNGYTYIIGSYFHTQEELNDFRKFVESFTFMP